MFRSDAAVTPQSGEDDQQPCERSGFRDGRGRSGKGFEGGEIFGGGGEAAEGSAVDTMELKWRTGWLPRVRFAPGQHNERTEVPERLWHRDSRGPI
jgi:hypothetical protein